MKQKKDRYEMHKYWGKKPSNDLNLLIEKYTNEGDTVFDPFSGYGVFCCEAFLLNRNVISNDLNPIACFLNEQLLEKNIDLNLLKKQWKIIKKEFMPFVNKWFEWNVDGTIVHLISILRNKDDIPIKARYKSIGKKAIQIELSKEDVLKFLVFERSQDILDWYPNSRLITNSRISAKKGMCVSDLFTKRTLSCHARLLSLIEKHTSGNEKALLKMAFTSNLANCSKLVPPIKSRGDMAPGAWMTGFYIGETYLENNVLHYFENRFLKIIKGKEDYLKHFRKSFDSIRHDLAYNNKFQILQGDAKNLDIKANSVDYIFTDPPYGDTVPYFEQSIIWNSWLKFNPDYENEIVISDSKERIKNNFSFEKEIGLALSEIRRVLKPNKFFSLTYHSMSGVEWRAITNACISNGFELVDYSLLVQKSFTPRQINRLKSIKGDVLVTLKKTEFKANNEFKSDDEITRLFITKIQGWVKKEGLETNDIFLKIMKIVFSERILIGNVDLFKILSINFEFSKDQKWVVK